MRHNVSILLGEDAKPFASRLAKYIYKYAEGNAEQFCQVKSWVADNDGVEIKKVELDNSSNPAFVSTNEKYTTRLVDDARLPVENHDLELSRYFTNLHQKTITVNNGGTSNQLLLTIFLPLYDAALCEQACDILSALQGIQSRYSVLLVGFCEDIRPVIHPENPSERLTPKQQEEIIATQRATLEKLAALRLESNCLENVVVLQNINAAGFALDLNEDSLIRIMGEMLLLTVEKYNSVFSQATGYDREHPLCTLGLSVLNLDKYYFANYLLRRAYLHILEREDVSADTVALNKVAVVANQHLQNHINLFSNFYFKHIEPLVQQKKKHEEIIAQVSPMLQQELEKVKEHLTDYIASDDFTLPEKKALLAVILGYDDPLLSGNLFNQNQPTLENLDEEVANIFIEANNELVTKKVLANGEEEIVKGPIKVCCDDEGKVKLPIKELQQLRNKIRESTNYIRQKSKELEEIGQMTEEIIESDKRLTEEGFVIDGNVYRFDIEHNEPKFDENYEAKPVTEKSVDLRDGFTPIKDQGQVGACTVFSVASIFEYILKKNSHKNHDLSELFVYYNVRHAEGKEKEDTGSSYQDVIASIGTTGICTEELHPYSLEISDEPSQEAYADAKSRRIVKALNVKVDEDNIKSAIQEGYPVAVSLKVYESFSTTTHSGNGSHIGASGFVSYPTDKEIASKKFGYHAMVIVGYTDDTKHFVVRNSWGEHFGDKGYCYIPYSYICDTELNRLACIITEVDASNAENITTVVGGRGGESTIVQFDMNDSIIKMHVINNLLEEEKRHLQRLQKADINLRHNYEQLMQDLGRQSQRTTICDKRKTDLENKRDRAKQEQNHINNVLRSQELQEFDSQTLMTRIILIGTTLFFLLLSILGVAFYMQKDSDGFMSWIAKWVDPNWMIWPPLVLCILSVIITGLYWWWIKDQRRRLEMDLEVQSAAQARLAHSYQVQLDVLKLRFHIAGMMVDGLLSIKASLNHKYQAMKSYIGNLVQWQAEEQKASSEMEPLVKNPFIPLLNNDTLNKYFNDNAEEITKDIRLYNYLKDYNLDDEAIVAYKKKLKESILNHLDSRLEDFSACCHVLKVNNYPYLDDKYASAQNLLPLLDQKSEPFCQIRRSATTSAQARFIFINTDANTNPIWQMVYPNHFQAPPISDDIESKFKVLLLRLQPLAIDEVNF